MAEKEKNVPNIQYVGKRKKLNKETGKMKSFDKEVPDFIIDGQTKIKLPDGIENGVFMQPETAAQLLALRPNDFKIPVIKEEK